MITLLGSNPYAHEAGTTFNDPGATAFDNLDGIITQNITITGTVNQYVPGQYTLTYNASDANGNAATPVTRTVNVQDTTKPVITLLGSNPYAHEAGTTFNDPGATAFDNLDGIITQNITITGTVNQYVPGQYTLTYNTSDANGNAATSVTRTVNVQDTTKPVISLLGSNPYAHEAGTTFNDPGATAFDNLDGIITQNITIAGTVNQYVPGQYTLTYNASDANGNAATSVTRTVNVQDTTKPVITLLGSNPYAHEAGSTYNDPGATAFDNLDGIITQNITITGTVNQYFPGQYTLTYNTSDANGNAAHTGHSNGQRTRYHQTGDHTSRIQPIHPQRGHYLPGRWGNSIRQS